MNKDKDTIVAISTPIGEGGIGIVRMSGDKAISIADKIFVSRSRKKVNTFKTHTIHYGHIGHGEIIDEVLLSVMRSPKTYTKENIVEINCHGGIIPLRKVFDMVCKLGARPAEPGEFTKRAFLSGRIDLAQAEAVCDIINAKTELSLKVAMNHLEGGYSNQIGKMRQELLAVLGDIEADIDFSEEHEDVKIRHDLKSKLEKLLKNLKEILSTKDMGMLFKEGVRCVICGKPNVGKSSLLNALLRKNRAIVTHIPGTTRDIIEESINIKGINVKLVDTAGIVRTKNIVERHGVDRSKNYIKKADMVIWMLDLSKTFDSKDRDVLELLPLQKTIIIANKKDLKRKLNLKSIKEVKNIAVHEISALNNDGINLVEKLIADKIFHGKIIHPEAAFITSARHAKEVEAGIKNITSAIQQAVNGLPLEIIAVDIRGAITHLGMITGENVDINVLDKIFSRFCIGK